MEPRVPIPSSATRAILREKFKQRAMPVHVDPIGVSDLPELVRAYNAALLEEKRGHGEVMRTLQLQNLALASEIAEHRRAGRETRDAARERRESGTAHEDRGPCAPDALMVALGKRRCL